MVSWLKGYVALKLIFKRLQYSFSTSLNTYIWNHPQLSFIKEMQSTSTGFTLVYNLLTNLPLHDGVGVAAVALGPGAGVNTVGGAGVAQP